MTRELKGWHVAAMFCFGFGVIIAVNLTLAYKAIVTFPGLEVKNSYVASQKFDAKRSAQAALGWDVAAYYTQGKITLAVTDANGVAVRVASIEASIGRATHVASDVTAELSFDGQSYSGPIDLEPGHWQVRMSARAKDGTAFEHRLPLLVAE